MSLLQVVYVSSATVPFTSAELEALAEVARKRNRGLGVTGMLLHHEGSFMQALEGPPEAVRGLLERIAGDPRHRNVLVLLKSEVEEREFGDWSMGLVDSQDLSEELRAAIEPVVCNDVGLDDTLLVPGRAHRLMQTFVRIAR